MGDLSQAEHKSVLWLLCQEQTVGGEAEAERQLGGYCRLQMGDEQCSDPGGRPGNRRSGHILGVSKVKGTDFADGVHVGVRSTRFVA